MIQLIKFETIDGDSIYVNENAIAGFSKRYKDHEIIQLNLIGETEGIKIKIDKDSVWLNETLDHTKI